MLHPCPFNLAHSVHNSAAVMRVLADSGPALAGVNWGGFSEGLHDLASWTIVCCCLQDWAPRHHCVCGHGTAEEGL